MITYSGYFRGVLIFVILVGDSAVTKINDNYFTHAQARRDLGGRVQLRSSHENENHKI